jgi:recombination protein RecA
MPSASAAVDALRARLNARWPAVALPPAAVASLPMTQRPPLARGQAPAAAPRQAPAAQPEARPWRWAALAGRLGELSAAPGAGVLTPAVALVRDAQAQGEPVAWVTPRASAFYPPDAAANGVDMAALTVVRVPDARAVARAGVQLARSGAFGLIVLDLAGAARPGRSAAALPPAALGRLAQCALRDESAILCLTEKPARAPSLGSLVSLRAQAQRRRLAPGAAGAQPERCFGWSVIVSKDKRQGPGWGDEEACYGPPGLR